MARKVSLQYKGCSDHYQNGVVAGHLEKLAERGYLGRTRSQIGGFDYEVTAVTIQEGEGVLASVATHSPALARCL